MRQSIFPPEVRAFIAQHVQDMPTKALTACVNDRFASTYTVRQITDYKSINGLKAAPLFAPEVEAYIAEHSYLASHDFMTVLVNDYFGTAYTPAQMRSYYRNHHVRNCIDALFQKGQPAFNKGVYSRRSPATEFKPGQLSYNYLPVGTEKLRSDGYIYG